MVVGLLVCLSMINRRDCWVWFFGDHMMTQVMKTTDYSRDTVPPFQILTKTFLDTLTILFRIQIMEHHDLTPREDAL